VKPSIVLIHGCFDVLHIGHIRLMKAANGLGDELVVSLLSDKFVTIAKGPDRPIHPLNIRIENLQALRCVHRIAIVDGPGHEAVEKMIAEVRPSVYVKGSEYVGKVPEQAFAESIGVKMMFLDMVNISGELSSSTRLIREFAD
jgi:rfaE bifunctional protein nucleotidyltransferase chain/domain